MRQNFSADTIGRRLGSGPPNSGSKGLSAARTRMIKSDWDMWAKKNAAAHAAFLAAGPRPPKRISRGEFLLK